MVYDALTLEKKRNAVTLETCSYFSSNFHYTINNKYKVTIRRLHACNRISDTYLFLNNSNEVKKHHLLEIFVYFLMDRRIPMKHRYLFFIAVLFENVYIIEILYSCLDILEA